MIERTVHRPPGSALVAGLVAVLLAACSSGGSAATGTGRQSAGPASGPTAAPTLAVPTVPATTVPATTPPAVGGEQGVGACDWITEAELTAILETTVPLNPAGEPTNCNWTATNFTILINLHEDEVTALEALKFADPKVEPVALGDEAIFSPVARGVYVRDGNRLLAVQIPTLPIGLDLKTVAVAVATVALPRF
jgi:hypothetical protein